MNQSHNIGAIGYSDQELFSQRGAGLVPGNAGPVAFQSNQGTNGVIATDNLAPCMAVENKVAVVVPLRDVPSDAPFVSDRANVTSKTNRTRVSPKGPVNTLAVGTDLHVVAFKPSHFTRGKDGAPSELMPPLSADADKGDQDAVVLTLEIRGREGERTLEWREDGTANCLRTPNGGRDGLGIGGVAFVHPRVFRNSDSSNQVGIKLDADVSDCLTSEGPGAVFSAMRESGQGFCVETTVAGTLDAHMDHRDTARPAVMAFSSKDDGQDAGPLCPTLRSGNNANSHANGGVAPAVVLPAATPVVRRLTPTEAERLQGFPDGYTSIPYRNKPAADGPRYKALGNSMAVPVMRWIGQRIALVDSIL